MYNVNLKIGDLIFNNFNNRIEYLSFVKIKLLSRNILNLYNSNSKKMFAILSFKISQESFYCYFCKNKKNAIP